MSRISDTRNPAALTRHCGTADTGTLREAIVLLGPTGAGKTPLGDCLEHHGWNKQRCRHFDFGEHLRLIDGGRLHVCELTSADRATIRRLLRDGVLLEDRQFHIAAAILRDFIRRRVRPGTLVILNGLPRHIGQARKISRLLRITQIIALTCTPAVTATRIRANSGGDRAGRSDDSCAAIARKLQWYRRRTKPLLDYYRTLGIPIRTIRITAATTPAQILHMKRRNPTHDHP